MKRVHHLLIILMLSAISLPLAQAQMAIGVRGGVHVAFNNLSFDHDFPEITTRDNITVLALAIPIEWPASKMFRLQSGLTFLTRGTRIHFRDRSAEINYIDKYAIRYIQIPIVGKLNLDFNPFNLYVIGGADLGYGIDFELIELAYNDQGPTSWKNRKLDFQRAGVSRFDIGMALGGGIEASISKGRRIFVDIRYHIGLNDIDKRPNVEVYNQGRSYTIGMMLPVNFKKMQKNGTAML
ncbi:MAG: porin family protein [Bacteroidota bacterium]